MAEGRVEFEQWAPYYLTGRLWRYLLRSRLERQPQHTTLEVWLKSFCLTHLDIAATFPDVKQTYGLFPLTQLCNLALQQLTSTIQKIEVSWDKELQTYLQQWQTYNQQLETTLSSLQVLIDRLFVTRIHNTCLAELLLSYEDNLFLTARSFSESSAFQTFFAHAQSEHFTLVLNYWQTVQHLEAFLTDMVLVNDVLLHRTIQDGSQFLLDNTYRAFFMSGPALLIFLSLHTKNIPTLLDTTQSQLILPCTLLQHLTPEEWNAIIKYEIGLRRHNLEALLANPSANFLAVFPFAVALQHAKTDLCFATALLTIPSWLAQLSDEDFEWITIKIACHQIRQKQPNVLLSNNTITMRLAAIFNDTSKRSALFTHYQWRIEADVFHSWFRDAHFLTLLHHDAFNAYFIQLSNSGLTTLLKPPSAFLQRLLTYATEELVLLCEQNATRTYPFTDAFLSQPALVAKLHSEDTLLRVLKLYYFKFSSLNEIRKINPSLDRHFAGPLLIKILKIIDSSFDDLEDPAELLARLSTTDKVEYVKWQSSGKTLELFLSESAVMQQLKTSELQQILSSITNQTAEACIKAELARRPDATPVMTQTPLDVFLSWPAGSDTTVTPSLYPSFATAHPLHSATTATSTGVSSSSGNPSARFASLALAPMPEPVLENRTLNKPEFSCASAFWWLAFERLCKVLVIGFTVGLVTAVLLPLPLPFIIGFAAALGAALVGCLLCLTRYACSETACYPRSNALSAFFLPAGESHHTKPDIRYTPLPEHEAPCCS